MNGEIRRIVFQLAAIGLVVALLLLVRCRAAEPDTFEGTLRYPMYNIGGEGSSAKLVTADDVYDLFFEGTLDHARLDRLAESNVRVIGTSRRAHGIERRDYRAIDVTELTAIDQKTRLDSRE